MPAGLAFLDRRKLALAGAKFRAWWEGEEFDDLRFVRIVGKEAGMELEYQLLPGERFKVMK